MGLEDLPRLELTGWPLYGEFGKEGGEAEPHLEWAAEGNAASSA